MEIAKKEDSMKENTQKIKWNTILVNMVVGGQIPGPGRHIIKNSYVELVVLLVIQHFYIAK